MAEVGNMPLPPKVLRKGITDMVRISDARMSGTAYGTVVLHTTPEAADGGPLAVVQNGDMIELNVPERRMQLLISDDELNQRLAAGSFDEAAAVDIELQPGQMSLHDVYMIHGAQANTSGQRRTGVALRYMPATSHFDRSLRPVDGKSDCLILDYIPADARNVAMLGDILGCPIPRAELLKSFQKDKPGATQIGFTFDGDDFEGQGDAAGASFEIVAKELHYLEASIWTWHRRDGLLTLGCGRGADGIERILAIRDGQLWAIWRNGVQQPDGSWKSSGAWAARPVTTDDPFAAGEAFAAKHATAELVAKGRGWHKAPISEGQAAWLYGLARGDMKRSEVAALNRGQAAGLITHYQAQQAIGRFEAAYASQAIEVSA